MEDIKLNLTTAIAIVVYIVSISAYVFGLRGDVVRIEENLSKTNAKLQRAVDKEIELLELTAKQEETMEFIENYCCDNIVSVKIVKDETDGTYKSE